MLLVERAAWSSAVRARADESAPLVVAPCRLRWDAGASACEVVTLAVGGRDVAGRLVDAARAAQTIVALLAGDLLEGVCKAHDVAQFGRRVAGRVGLPLRARLQRWAPLALRQGHMLGCRIQSAALVVRRSIPAGTTSGSSRTTTRTCARRSAWCGCRANCTRPGSTQATFFDDKCELPRRGASSTLPCTRRERRKKPSPPCTRRRTGSTRRRPLTGSWPRGRAGRRIPLRLVRHDAHCAQYRWPALLHGRKRRQRAARREEE